MKEYLYQFIPERFDYLTENKKILYKEKNLKTDYLINLIHEFLIKYFFSEDINSLKINLWSLILRKRYGMNYNYYVGYLLENGFIKLVSDYYVAKKSKTYQINYFDVSSLKRVRIFDKILLKKYERSFLERNVTEFNSSPIPLSIRKKLVDDIYYVNIDYDKSLKMLKDLKLDKKINDHKYYKNYSSINGIKDKHLFFKFDSYGRFHSNFTILKRDVRNNFLKIDGNDVCELDIKNSQPFFLSILMKKYMTDWAEYDDVDRYFFMVNNGLIYDDIADRYNISREKSKIMIYKVLFGKNGDFKKASNIFSSLYPNVYDFICNHKDIKGNHKVMSHDLQKIESEFIFNNIISKIMKNYPLVRVVTIHDSIIFPCYYEKEITKIFYDELEKLKSL